MAGWTGDIVVCVVLYLRVLFILFTLFLRIVSLSFGIGHFFFLSLLNNDHEL